MYGVLLFIMICLYYIYFDFEVLLQLGISLLPQDYSKRTFLEHSLAQVNIFPLFYSFPN